MAERLRTYSAFFDFYLAEHSLPLTRALHYVASTCGIAALVATVVSGRLVWIPVGLVTAYGLAWVAHFFVEHNRPATFRYPLWSFLADYHMYFLLLTGGLVKRRARIGQS